MNKTANFQGLCSAKENGKYCNKPATKTIEDWYFCDQHMNELKLNLTKGTI